MTVEEDGREDEGEDNEEENREGGDFFGGDVVFLLFIGVKFITERICFLL